jgi:hypothetical protein
MMYCFTKCFPSFVPLQVLQSAVPPPGFALASQSILLPGDVAGWDVATSTPRLLITKTWPTPESAAFWNALLVLIAIAM